MKISHFMQKTPVTIDSDKPIRDAVRLIFNVGITAVMVLDEKKLVGIITEEDILHHLFPSVREFMEDYIESRDFGAMEKKMELVLDQPVNTIMTRKVHVIDPDTPVMHAESLMLLHKFSHLPVVDSGRKLIGIISQGDIFRALVSEEIPFETQAEYHNWVARYYDMAGGQIDRRKAEYEQLDELFKKYKIRRVIDIGCGTGNHVIALAKKGYAMVGLESSKGMFKEALKKYDSLPNSEKNSVAFMLGENYVTMINARKQQYDCAIFMGNSLAHMPDNYRDVLGSVERNLAKDKAMMVMHLVNSDRVINITHRLQSFNVEPSNTNPNGELAFLEFYDPPRKGGRTLTLTMGVLQFNGKRWSMVGSNSTALAYITPTSLTGLLRALGFNRIEIFGSNHGESPFGRSFSPKKDDWFTVVARR